MPWGQQWRYLGLTTGLTMVSPTLPTAEVHSLREEIGVMRKSTNEPENQTQTKPPNEHYVEDPLALDIFFDCVRALRRLGETPKFLIYRAGMFLTTRVTRKCWELIEI